MASTERIIKLLDELHRFALKGPDSLLGDAELRQVGVLRKQIRNEIAVLQATSSIDYDLKSQIIAAIDVEMTSTRAAAAIEAVIKTLK